MTPTQILLKAHLYLLYLAGGYLALLGIFATPFIQRHAIFSHALRWPLWAKYDEPVRYGLAPFKTYNMALTTSDNYTIHAWHVLSDPYYHTHTPYPTLPRHALPPTAQRDSLHSHPTIIYFHGNAASRAAKYRVQICSSLSTRLGVNVVAPDYRGFGDNTGKPSEEGLARDGRAVWDWLTKEMGVPEHRIVLMGQSLGTGVVSRVAYDLAKEGIRPRGIVLIAPFASIEDLLSTYTIFKFLPLLRPLQIFPPATKYYLRFLKDRFESQKYLQTVETTILLLHARDDPDIPYHHSEILFDTLLDPLLPSPSSSSLSEEERAVARTELVKIESVENFATIQRFGRPGGKGDVIFLNTLYGGHNLVSNHEGAMDVVGRVMQLGAGQDED